MLRSHGTLRRLRLYLVFRSKNNRTVAFQRIYLYYIGAIEKAGRLLALTVSQLHCLGFTRQEVVGSLPVFKAEMHRRLWLCVYYLNRQLAIESELPTVIQDINVDLGCPLNLSDNWLSLYSSDTRTTSQLDFQVQEELSKSASTPIPFL